MLSNAERISIGSVFRATILGSVIILGSACSGYKGVPLGTVPAPRPETVQNNAHGKALAESFAQKYQFKTYSSSSDSQRVSRILNRLAKAAGLPAGKCWPFGLIDAGSEVNAVAVNQNTILVYKELLRRVKTDEQLSVILAHEVAHILAQHGEDSEATSKAGWIEGAGVLLGHAAAVATAYAGGGSALIQIAGEATYATTGVVGAGAFIQSYSRAQEYEADQIGMMLMARSGYNPAAAPAFWKDAEQILGDESGWSFLKGHPSHSDRADSLEEALPTAQSLYRKK